MVIYRLGIYSGENSKELLNKGSEDSLKKIDEFTSNFSNEDSLKQFLLENKLINPDDLDKKLSIIYKNNGDIKTLPVIYQGQKEYLVNYIIRHKLDTLVNNQRFLNRLIDFYDYGGSVHNLQSENINNLKIYLADLNQYGKKAVEFDRKLIEFTLDDLVKVATTKYDKKSNFNRYNHRGTRDLGMLIYNFEELEKLEQIKNNIKSEEEIKYELAKKNNKWILSSDGDPYFPPNSEEERQYLLEQEKELEEFEKQCLQGEILLEEYERRQK